MTNADMNVNRKEKTLQFGVMGHSDYADAGADIVCAGISVLSESFLAMCYEMEEKGIVKIVDCTVLDALIYIEVQGDLDAIESGIIMLRSGLEGIAENYPENFTLSWGEK